MPKITALSVATGKSPLPPAPTQAFPYRLEARVGEGSMGVVYRAVEPALDRPVAVKVLKADSATCDGDVRGTRSSVERRDLMQSPARPVRRR